MNIDLAGIGQILKTRREEKGLSVAQIAESLCLRRTLIEAMEAGDWGPLPHEVYVRGFLKEYAVLLHAYKDVADYFVGTTETAAPLTETVIELPSQPKKKEKKRQAKEKREPTPRRFFKVRYALFAILAAALIIFAYDRIERERTAVSKAENAARVAEKAQGEAVDAARPEAVTNAVRPEAVTNTVRPLEVKTGVEGGALSAMSEPKRLMITCHERTWVSVVIDDSEKKEFILSPNEIIVINAKDRFDLLVGNAGGIKMLLNGKETEFTGKSGEVKRIRLS